MTLIDYLVLGILGISVLLSVMRGALREVLALVSWLLAFLIAKLYTVEALPYLPDDIPTPELKLLAAFLFIFFAVLLCMTLLTITLSELVKMAGLMPLDRFLGAVFGLTRGLLMLVVMTLMIGLTTLPKKEFWRHAMFSPLLEEMVEQGVKPWLPQALSSRIHYD